MSDDREQMWTEYHRWHSPTGPTPRPEPEAQEDDRMGWVAAAALAGVLMILIGIVGGVL